MPSSEAAAKPRQRSFWVAVLCGAVILTIGMGARQSFSCYLNRSMIGAVVGVQPFGGEALSGTGPKAGGPRYLHRFATERTVSTDTTAAGGNATLLSLQEEN